MENPAPRKDFDRIVASAKRAGLLKALYEIEGLAIIEVPVPTAAETPAALTPPASSPAVPKV